MINKYQQFILYVHPYMYIHLSYIQNANLLSHEAKNSRCSNHQSCGNYEGFPWYPINSHQNFSKFPLRPMILLWQSPCPDFGSDGGHPSMTTEQESPAAVKLIGADRQMVEVRFITIVLGEIRHSIIKSYGILSHRGIHSILIQLIHQNLEIIYTICC